MVGIRAATQSDLESVFTIVRAAIVQIEKDGIHRWDEVYSSIEDLAHDNFIEVYGDSIDVKIVRIWPSPAAVSGPETEERR